MTTNCIKIVLAQLNLTVGDIVGNTNKIIDSIQIASDDHKADIVLFPELAISSYPPEDLLLRPAFHHYIEKALNDIVKATKNIHVLLGYPYLHNSTLYNACSLIPVKRHSHTGGMSPAKFEEDYFSRLESV